MDPAISPHTMSNSTSKLSNHIYSNTFKMTIQKTSQKLTHPLSLSHTSICVKWFSEISKSSRLLVTSRCCPSSGSLRPKVKKRKWFRASNSARSSPVFLLLVDTSPSDKEVFRLPTPSCPELYCLCSLFHSGGAQNKTAHQHHIHLMMRMFKSKPRCLTQQENGLQIFCAKTRHIKHLPGVQIFSDILSLISLSFWAWMRFWGLDRRQRCQEEIFQELLGGCCQNITLASPRKKKIPSETSEGK